MAETEFRVKYDGPSLRDGRMEVRDLAPALLALADLFRDANALLNPDHPSVSLHIQATDTGSFDVVLALVQPDAVDQVMTFFIDDPVTALVNIKELVIGSGAGLFAFIRWLKKRRIRSQEPTSAGTTLFTTADGDTLEIRPEVAQLYRNARIRRRTREVVQPLAKEGIESVDFYVERESETVLELTNEDVASFELPADEVEPILDQTTTMALAIVAPGLDEGFKWRLSDGDRPSFFAGIEDNEFLDRVDNGEAFRKGDILTCSMRVVQTRTEEGGLHTEYTVTHVHDHIPRSRPIQLSLGDAVPAEERVNLDKHGDIFFRDDSPDDPRPSVDPDERPPIELGPGSPSDEEPSDS